MFLHLCLRIALNTILETQEVKLNDLSAPHTQDVTTPTPALPTERHSADIAQRGHSATRTQRNADTAQRVTLQLTSEFPQIHMLKTQPPCVMALVCKAFGG